MTDDQKKNQNEESEGRGWHGDSEGHAEVGRKGGEAKSSEFANEEETTTERQKSESSM